jgi:hypothetical protein
LGSRDTINLLRLVLQILLGKGARLAFLDVIQTVISTIRHRAETIAQQPVLLVDIARASVALFVRRRTTKANLDRSHAAVLSRLLSLLGTSRSRDSDKTSSHVLVKHLPAVLLAYVRAVADPRGKVTTEVRRELRPGLESICDAVTARGRVHSRGREGEALGDAYGLGEGPGGEVEKDIWADMWQTWAKTRYTGQG